MSASGPPSLSAPQPALAAWAAVLARAAAVPLEPGPRVPAIARRFEAWWTSGSPDRPVFLGHADGRPDRALGHRIDLLSDPEATR